MTDILEEINELHRQGNEIINKGYGECTLSDSEELLNITNKIIDLTHELAKTDSSWKEAAEEMEKVREAYKDLLYQRKEAVTVYIKDEPPVEKPPLGKLRKLAEETDKWTFP